jgi:hypothetical protein
MVRAWVVTGWVFALAGAAAGCGNKQVTQERATESSAATDDSTSSGDDDPSGNPGPGSNDDDPATSDPVTSTSSPTDPTSGPDTDPDTGSGSGGTGTTSGWATGSTGTGGSAFWCADEDLGAMAVPVSHSGSNVGRTDFYLGSCTDGVNGDEVLLTWTAPEAGTYFIDTLGSAIDTVLYVLDGCGGFELACNDDISIDLFTSSLSIDLSAGEQILIVVDGYDSAASGAFELYISS